MLDQKGVARFGTLLSYKDIVLYKFICGTKPVVIISDFDKATVNHKCFQFNINVIPFGYLACLLVIFLERQTLFEPTQNTRIGITMCQFRY